MHFAAKAGHISVIDKLSQKKAKLEVETKVRSINIFVSDEMCADENT